MTTRENHLEIGSGNTKSGHVINEFGVGHRIVGPIVVLIALVLGAVQWMQTGRDAAAPSAAQQESQVSNPAEPFVSFHAQYVNQGTEVPEHIEAF